MRVRATRQLFSAMSVACLLILGPTSLLAQEDTATELQVYEQSVASLRALLAETSKNGDQLNSLAEDTTRLIAKLQRCTREQEKLAVKAESELESLGDAIRGESQIVHEQRAALKKQQTTARTQLASCRVLLDEALTTSVKIQAQRRELIRQRLLVPGPDLLQVAGKNLASPGPWIDYGRLLIQQYQDLLSLERFHLALFVTIMLAAMLPGWLLRSALHRWGAQRTDNEFTSILLQSLNLALARYLPALLATIAGAIFFLLLPTEQGNFHFWINITYCLAAILIFMLVVRTFLYPFNQIPSPLLLPRDLSQSMARRLRVLGLLSFLGVAYLASLDDITLPLSARDFARGVFISLVVLNLIWLVWLLGQLPGNQSTSRRIRGTLAALLTAGLVAEWLGYRGLSSYLLVGVVGTAILTAVCWTLHVLLSDLINGLDRGKFAWQRSLRESVGLSEGTRFPGLTTLKVLLILGLWSGLVLLLMLLWGVPDTLFQQLYIAFQDGFQIAGLRITPSRIIVSLLIFALLLQVFSRVKEGLDKRWLPASKLDRGAREATVTMFGYLGFLVAFLIALASAGLDLSKLAIIAGALSVGIGFGLQNVVNNFVSGLILLFERPISTGDFVSVGDTEGHVRKISIRSTEIETMDRRSVIVPNSDLISGKVINWMRNDSFGRVKVDVGVAYGTDLKLVMELLRDIATSHPDVINNSVTKPSVYCTGFGDSSINFSIFAVVGNFTQRFQVMSDICLSIDKAFAQHDIEIPFPQRVVHTVSPKEPK